MLEAALRYATRGWRVFPLHSVDKHGWCSCGNESCTDAGKHPRVSRGVRAASSDEEQLRKWFGKGAPPSNIAIATGAVSGITVLDIDVGADKKGDETWAELIKEHGEPDTLVARTGSGGMHVFFKYNSALPTAANVLGPGVDCRNDGGYVVAAPSLHRSGGRYAWLDEDAELAVLPAHLSRKHETRGRPRKDDHTRARHTLPSVRSMLSVIPADDRDLWRHVGIILGREFDRSDDAWGAYCEWAGKYAGKKGRNHDAIMRECFYELSQQPSDRQLSVATIVRLAVEHGWAPKNGEVPIEHFVFYGPGNNFIYRPTCSQWTATAVDAAVSPVNEDGKIVRATDWLRLNQLCTSMTRDPSIDTDYLRGHDCSEGEIVEVAGAALFNSYRRPTVVLGDAQLAAPFVDHVRRIFNKPGDSDQFLDYMAHRVQKPWEKPRFALLIAGGQGVGKDTAIEMCCPAIGVWNVANIDPSAFESSFNEYAAATLVRISEAANLHEMNKWSFNERTKVLIAGSPDVCQINPKYGQKYSVRMFCGVIITTNHLASGIYIPEDDRRYDVIETATMKEMGLGDERSKATYFRDLWEWYVECSGASHVAAFLHARDISRFSAANGQRKTEAHKDVVANSMVTDSWLDDILCDMGDPPAVRGDWIEVKAVAAGDKAESVRRKIRAAMQRRGYSLFRCPSTKDGRWRVGGKNVTVYVTADVQSDFDPREHLQQQEPF